MAASFAYLCIIGIVSQPVHEVLVLSYSWRWLCCDHVLYQEAEKGVRCFLQTFQNDASSAWLLQVCQFLPCDV